MLKYISICLLILLSSCFFTPQDADLVCEGVVDIAQLAETELGYPPSLYYVPFVIVGGVLAALFTFLTYYNHRMKNASK